jgi:hypothetical protein
MLARPQLGKASSQASKKASQQARNANTRHGTASGQPVDSKWTASGQQVTQTECKHAPLQSKQAAEPPRDDSKATHTSLKPDRSGIIASLFVRNVSSAQERPFVRNRIETYMCV